MHVVIVDETTIVAQAAHRALLSMDVTTTLAGSPHELPLVFETRLPDFMIVNVTNDLTGWEVAARLKRAGYRGRLLAFVDGDLADSLIRPLSQLPNVERVALPASSTL